MKKKKNSVLRKKYSTRDIELRIRSKKKCCTEKQYETSTELGRKIREMSCLEMM
jgi:hypothetical protein